MPIPEDTRASRHAHRPRPALAAFLALAAVASVALAARWWPRERAPATPEMRSAMAAAAGLAARPGPPPEPPAEPANDRERLLAAAFALRGAPYRFGAKGPREYDCSGFTKQAYASAGIRLPDGSFNQAEGEQPLDSLDTLTPGDLLFYRWPGETGVSHVTMYAGDGWVIGTGSPGQPPHVVLYPLLDDLVDDGRVITWRHIAMGDERR